MSYYSIRTAANSQFIFRFSAANHEQILASETYTTKQSCEGGIAAVRRLCPYDSNYRRSDIAGNYRFTIVAHNGEIVAKSSEGYTTRQAREHAIDLVKRDGPNAPTYDWS